MRRKVNADAGAGSNVDGFDHNTNVMARVKPTTLIIPIWQTPILFLKLGVVFGLAVLKALLGYSAYEVVRMSEHRQFQQAYNTLISNIIPSTNIGMSYLKLNFIFMTDHKFLNSKLYFLQESLPQWKQLMRSLQFLGISFPIQTPGQTLHILDSLSWQQLAGKVMYVFYVLCNEK